MDPVGTVIFLGDIVCLLLGLTWAGHIYSWNDSRIIGLFVGFGLLTICLGAWLMKQGEIALIPLRILRKRSIAMGALTLFCLNLSMTVVSLPSASLPSPPPPSLPDTSIWSWAKFNMGLQYGYYLPIFFQSAQGVSITSSGVRQIALIIPDILAIGLTGLAVTKWGHYVSLWSFHAPG